MRSGEKRLMLEDVRPTGRAPRGARPPTSKARREIATCLDREEVVRRLEEREQRGSQQGFDASKRND
ncbi:unnamed protein product [Urochloa humidicola]